MRMRRLHPNPINLHWKFDFLLIPEFVTLISGLNLLSTLSDLTIHTE